MQYEKTIILKNGEECLLRSAGAADAESVYESFMLTHTQTDFLLTYPDENDFSLEDERRFLTEKESSPNEIEICAVVSGKIAGTAGIESIGSKYKVRHRAEFGISVECAYWGLGIGRALLAASIECARRAGYAQLELSVIADNERALALYKSAGFVEFGRNPRGFRSRSVGWQEVVLMRMELD